MPKKKAKNPRKRAGDCGPARCDKLDLRKLAPGYNKSRAGQRPRYANGAPAPAFGPQKKLRKKKVKRLNNHFRNRVRMAQSLDDLVGEVMRTVGPDTYVVFTSDNGYHLGQHRLHMGKGSAYDHDVRVPLVVAGPGVRPGPRYQVTQSIDLAPTFEQLAGVRSPAYRDGRSLVPLLRNPRASWGRYAFVEHTRPTPSRDDPDAEGSIGAIPSYVAIRSADALLVRYDTRRGDPAGYTYEFYRGLTRKGAWEQRNVYSPYDPQVRSMLARLDAYPSCEGSACRALAQ